MANFLKITDNPDLSFIEMHNFNKKFIANSKAAFTVGSDAGQTFESGVKIQSIQLPHTESIEKGMKLKLLKSSSSINFHCDITFAGSALPFHMEYNYTPDYNLKQFLTFTSENITAFYQLGAGVPRTFNDAQKYYIFYLTALTDQKDVKIFNSEIVNAQKMTFLNIYTDFGFKAGIDDGDLKAGLLAHAKLDFGAAATAVAITRLEINIQIEFDVVKKPVRISKKINVKKSVF